VGKTPAETLRNIPVNIREFKPTFLFSVPALARNFRKNIEAAIRQRGPFVEGLFRQALRIAYVYNADGWNRGRGLRKLLKPALSVFDRMLFRKIREGFGGELEFFIGGGALLDIELQRFFYALGLPMLQGYGLTEAAPVISANVLARHKLGSSGHIVPDLEVRVCDSECRDLPRGTIGEIVVRGENVMAGYWKNESATRQAIRDGWLFTGDLGYVDEDDFLYVMGRVKSLLISNDGEKYSPEGIEEALVANSEFIDQIMLYNNQSPYTVALLAPHRQNLHGWLKAQGLSCATPEGQSAALKLLESEIDQYRSGGKFEGMFPSKWLPAAFAVLEEGFTEQNRLLNATLKMVRGKIVEVHQERLNGLFTSEGKAVVNPPNMSAIARLNG
jgi:long-chain acyl-CoA synthetase